MSRSKQCPGDSMGTMRAGLVFGWIALFLVSVAEAQEREPAAILHFEIGASELTPEHRSALDDLRRRYPPERFDYAFEGDHDPTGYTQLSPTASQRVSERLAESRWQNAARHLGVPPFGLVRSTGKTEVRVYAAPKGRVLEDSLAILRRELQDLRRKLAERPAPVAIAPARQVDTVLAVARLEKIHQRSDKWMDRRWWETQFGVEIGILRVQPERGRPTGATLVIGNGSPAYHPFEITTRLDVARFGSERIGIRPALRWYDWDIRVHYGDDREARASFLNQSDPIYLLGLDLDATPWPGARIDLQWAGAGARVHAGHRALVGYDHYDLRFEQRLTGRSRLEAQAVYDERFEKSLAYAGGWVAYGWPLRLGEFSLRLGFVEQLDAFAATAVRRPREDHVSTVSVGFAWQRSVR